jgi:hypothetical protein
MPSKLIHHIGSIIGPDNGWSGRIYYIRKLAFKRKEEAGGRLLSTAYFLCGATHLLRLNNHLFVARGASMKANPTIAIIGSVNGRSYDRRYPPAKSDHSRSNLCCSIRDERVQ